MHYYKILTEVAVGGLHFEARNDGIDGLAKPGKLRAGIDHAS